MSKSHGAPSLRDDVQPNTFHIKTKRMVIHKCNSFFLYNKTKKKKKKKFQIEDRLE